MIERLKEAFDLAGQLPEKEQQALADLLIEEIRTSQRWNNHFNDPRAEMQAGDDQYTPRKWRYTNAVTEFPEFDELPYFHVNMDTWYYSELVDPNHQATLGKVALGENPITPAQDVGRFIAEQVVAFRDSFSDIFRPALISVGVEPRLTGVVHFSCDYSPPVTQDEVEALQTSVNQASYSNVPYEGVTNLSITFDMHAIVRDEHGEYTQVWLPEAGHVRYSARYTDGTIPTYPAVTHILTPLAQRGRALWTATLECNFISLFRQSNADVLNRVRSQWHDWLQDHPLGEESRDANGELLDEPERSGEYFVVTLAELPPGTPPDNRELSERNLPRLRAALSQWEETLVASFEWAVTL
jgi:hypothetical protein